MSATPKNVQLEKAPQVAPAKTQGKKKNKSKKNKAKNQITEVPKMEEIPKVEGKYLHHILSVRNCHKS